jgi:serine/threonine protein kinase
VFCIYGGTGPWFALDIASDDGIDFIVMEYVAGLTLERRIPRHGMRLGELLDVAIQVADALANAHAAGIVHRDLNRATS